MIDGWTNSILTGECREVMAGLPESSMHTAATSPPYWGLRNYQKDEQISMEDSVGEFVAELVDVGRSIRRVLRPDGSWWLNLGDTYAGGGGVSGKPDDWDDMHTDETYPDDPPAKHSRFAAKTKLLVPHRVAIALIDDGWIVRNDAIWRKKGGGMPESVKDRLSTTTESVFHLVPQSEYWYDLNAIREPYSAYTQRMQHRTESPGKRADFDDSHHGIDNPDLSRRDITHPSGKNPGDLFIEPTASFPDAHFAVMPESLVEPLIKSTCPPTVCATCGTPYDRQTESKTTFHSGSGKSGRTPKGKHTGRSHVESGDYDIRMGPRTHHRTIGWQQQCDCDTDETEPGIVLDPFAGAGTTCKVGKEHGRRFVGIELNPEYVAMAQARCGLDVEHPETLTDEDQSNLGAYALTDGGQQ